MIDAAKSKWVIDVGDANFEQDVLKRSSEVVVLVDFWAEWCGPCKQLGPLLERMAQERKGAFVLAKVNVDEAQQIAGYFRIESIPAVLAFKDSQPVNGFVGLVSEEELKTFLDELSGPAPNDPVVEAAALEERSPEKAEAIYRDLLAKDERNDPARLGLGRVQIAKGQDDEALETLALIPDAGEFGAEAVKLRRTIEMKKNAATAGDEQAIKKSIKADPQNAQLHLDLGNLLATKGMYEPALGSLIQAAELDLELGRGAVRELMVKIFEIIGVRSELADTYRDKLRAMLY